MERIMNIIRSVIGFIPKGTQYGDSARNVFTTHGGESRRLLGHHLIHGPWT